MTDKSLLYFIVDRINNAICTHAKKQQQQKKKKKKKKKLPRGSHGAPKHDQRLEEDWAQSVCIPRARDFSAVKTTWRSFIAVEEVMNLR